jgi:rhodanese-related sulfurtransferase
VRSADDSGIGPSSPTRHQRLSTLHRVLAIVALLAGVLAALSGTPYRAQRIGALELAQWIHDHKPGLRIVDIRGAADFADYHLPRSERVTTLVAPEPGETLVIIDDVRTPNGRLMANHGQRTTNNEQRATDNDQRSTINEQRPAISDQRGRNIYYLKGGVGEWLSEVMSPVQSSELMRYFGGQPRAGSGAPPAVHTIRRRGC